MKVSTLALVALVSAVACGGEDGGGGGGSGETGDPLCPGAMDYHAGVQKLGSEGRFMITIVQATPAPPHISDNSWTVRVTDASGAPVDGATLTVAMLMPLHDRHPGARGTTVTPKGDGTYELAPVNFIMAGLWETTIEVQSSATDSVMFPFCVVG